MAEITKDDLEYFIEQEQDRGIMISTVRTKLNFVNAFIRHWTEEGIIRVEVLARKIRLKRPDTLPRAMDPDDVQQLLSVIDQPRDRALVLVLLRTGMRIGELLNTRMSDIHLNDRKIDCHRTIKCRSAGPKRMPPEEADRKIPPCGRKPNERFDEGGWG